MQTIERTADSARLTVVPDMGAGIAELAVRGSDGVERPVLRPWTGRPDDGPFALACNLLVPFSNRISDGFSFEGKHHPLEPNLPGDRYPIHGDGFQRAWSVTEGDHDGLELVLQDGAFGPFRYRAIVRYKLEPRGLTCALDIRNTGNSALPFGLGFHPWFPRMADTRLRFDASHVWLVDDDYMPTRCVPIGETQWDFSEPAPLPSHSIHYGFAGWPRRAVLHQGDGACSCTISASDNLDIALVYSPSDQADFVCFEPVSHPVDAHNMADQPGLVVLQPGQSTSGWMRIEWEADQSKAS